MEPSITFVECVMQFLGLPQLHCFLKPLFLIVNGENVFLKIQSKTYKNVLSCAFVHQEMLMCAWSKYFEVAKSVSEKYLKTVRTVS